MAIVYDSFFNGAVFGGGFFKAGTETDTVDTHDGAGVQFRDVDDYRDVESEYTETIGDIHPTVKRFCVCQGSFRKSVLHCVR